MNGIGCLYNCGSDSTSTQEYHIYPASASTLDFTLECGAVCDSCNAYFSKLEGYFANHHPGAAMRVWKGVRTRKGKTPKFAHKSGVMTRVDGDEGRDITTPLGDVRFERQLNGDFTIVGSYTPLPFDASKISRILHKIAFEILLGFPEDPELNPMSDRFAPLRDFVRRPKSGTDFRPFAWMRSDGPQEVPKFITVQDPETDELIADICELKFPGITYVVAFPPWPTACRLWNTILDSNINANFVDSPGTTILEAEEIRIPMQLQRM